MKQKHLSRLVAFLVGTAGAAFGDDHGMPEVDCPDVDPRCERECEAWGECIFRCNVLEQCDADIECWFLGNELQRCLDNIPEPPPTDPGGFIPPPPGACPAGQHLNEGECEEDHECGDDEIGGGSEECEECGEGEVPNEDGIACVTCQFGESDTPGRCNPDPCNRAGVDDYVVALRFQRRPFETGSALFCRNHTVGGVWERSSPDNACRVDFNAVYSESCWRGGSRTTGCTLASAHTHPYFTKADEGTICHGESIDERLAARYNNLGMDFSPEDKAGDRASGVEGYLGVSDASCVRAHRISGGTQTIAGECSRVPLEPEPW